MKQGQWQHQIKKINIDLSLSNPKTNTRHRDSFGLGLHIRDGKAHTFKTILRKVYEAQSRKYNPTQIMTVSRYVSKREKAERQSAGMYQSLPPKSQEEERFQGDLNNGGKGNICTLLKNSIKSVKQTKEIQQFKPIITASPPPYKQQTEVNIHQQRDAARSSINPYSGNQYLYLENASKDSFILSRCSTSKKKFRNSITKSYKISGIHLRPQQPQKRTLDLKKTLDSDKISLKQRKKKSLLRKASEVLPWQWHEQNKSEF